MMDLQKLRPLDERVEIVRAIEKATPFGGEVWQTHPDGRQSLIITQIHLDLKFDKILLNTYGLITIDETLPLYIRFSYRNFIFRLDPSEYRLMGEKLLCNYPKEARALDQRKTDRYVLPLNADVSLTLRKSKKTFRDKVMDIEVRILDVSERGFGIIISSANKDYLKKSDHFSVVAIDHQLLDHYIPGSVAYVSPNGYYLKHGDVRIGLSLAAALDKKIFEYLKRRAEMVLSA